MYKNQLMRLENIYKKILNKERFKKIRYIQTGFEAKIIGLTIIMVNGLRANRLIGRTDPTPEPSLLAFLIIMFIRHHLNKKYL